jgi:hypothetical protein
MSAGRKFADVKSALNTVPANFNPDSGGLDWLQKPILAPDSMAEILSISQPCGIALDALAQGEDGWTGLHGLRAGAKLRTIDGGTVRIARIWSYAHQGTGSVAPILIDKGILGAHRRTVVAPNQMLYLRHFLAAALFGSETILAPAQGLADGLAPDENGDNAQVVTETGQFCVIETARFAVVNVNGIWLETHAPSQGKDASDYRKLNMQESAAIAKSPSVFRAKWMKACP